MQEGTTVETKRHPIAVVIPTFNRADVLMKCLGHLERQSCTDFEVVVVDDGSTDSTSDRMKSYLRDTALAIRYLRQENHGPARARNHAISLVEAPIVLLIGDDIFASPGLVAEHLKLHRNRPEDSVAGLGLTQWSEAGQTVTAFMKWLDSDGLQFDYGSLLRGNKPNWGNFWTSNISLKTGVLKEFPFDESFPHAAMEDIELACRIESRHGLDMVFLPEALADHFHPTTFVQACSRMVKVGESTAYFDQLWPGKRRVTRNILKRPLQSILLTFPRAIPIWVKLADWSLKLVCPNSLMRYVLSCHFAIGYDKRKRGQP
jgi:cellulose synthase/poly-beta-1,6-N-acetylglucosamine synthase-like glycosyltransferase